MKTSTRVLLALLATALVAALGFYVIVPAINVYNEEFWVLLAMLAGIFCLVYWLTGFKNRSYETKTSHKSIKSLFKLPTPAKIGVIFIIIPVAVLIVGSIISSTFFNAEKYSQIIEVNEAVFEDDMPEAEVVSNIALMDSESAAILGNRKLGALSSVVSQYQIGSAYSQINYKGTPQKVANLEYVDFFRWFNNRDKGIPGFVMVDPVNSSADYIEFEKPMKYVDSAYFDKDLHRALRFSYPTKIFGSYAFELDDNGNPYYIVSCMSPKVGLFGAMDVSEVIIFDPCDGSSDIYDVDETPAWVDNVFTGTLAAQKYDWHGTLANGFWNSVIGKKDCKVTTDDFGYIILGDDVWFFTGVTSVSSDESNIGFIISNARTGEYKFYSVIGAEEYSAMSAAEGEVQETGYTASFPSLINVSGEATYIMVLKDNAGYVKLYALVNVENPSIVATDTTQEKAKLAYLELLGKEGIIDEEETNEAVGDEKKSAEITVKEIRLATVSGESVVYINGSDGSLYKQNLASDETLLLIESGDKITVEYYDTDVEKVKKLDSWTYTVEEE
ncbi:MAG: hypothetical protein IKL59_07400 [Clostridia bacterium]|nr:hypothetical protein [Clostridia bacterium]